MNRLRLFFVLGLILCAAALRVLPHPANVAPIGAMALFAGAYLGDRRFTFAVPILALLVSDAVLGFYSPLMMLAVYASFAANVGIGTMLRRERGFGRVSLASLAGSVQFFLVTNLAVWAFGNLYPKTAAGLAGCYGAAVPFFGRTVAGDLGYTLLLFGAMTLAERTVLRLREQTA